MGRDIDERDGPRPAPAQSIMRGEVSSALVGRDTELDRLNRGVGRLRGGAGGVIHLVGPSGIGKSRLVDEFKRSDTIDGVAVVEGGAITMGRNIPFHPFAHLLRGWAGIAEGDGREAAYSKIRGALAPLYPEGVDEAVPFIATAMGMELSDAHASRLAALEGVARESLIMKNTRDLFGRIAERAPLVVIMEDFHWVDPSSGELMSSLYRLVPKKRILFIIVYIPEYREATGGIEGAARAIDPDSFTEIELGPLIDSQCRRLIGNLLNTKALRHDTFRTIIAKSKGSPLFLEEAIRYLIGEGAVAYEKGSYLPLERIGEVVIPDTLKDLLKARLSQLDTDTQELIRISSVLGRNITSRVLAEISVSREDLKTLASVRGPELLSRREELERDNLFKHALGQETAYGSMMKSQQKELHLKVADTIEHVFSRRLHEFYGILAYHYGNAGIEGKTLEYLIKAGQEALESSAFTEALNYLMEAYDIHGKTDASARDSEMEFLLEKNIAVALYSLGRYEESVAFFTRTLAFYGEKEPTHPIAKGARFLRGLASFIVSIYLPALKWRRLPTERDREFLKLFYMKSSALANFDARRFILEAFYFARRFTDFDLTRVDNGIVMFAGYSGVFSWTGISFGLSRRVLSFVKDRVDRADPKSVMNYEIVDMIHNFFVGEWENNTFDEDVLDHNLRRGEIISAVNYVTLHGQFATEKGDIAAAERMLSILFEIASTYDNTFAWAYWHTLSVKALVKRRIFSGEFNKIEGAIEYCERNSLTILLCLLLSTKAQVRAITGDFRGSADSLRRARAHYSAVERLPYYLLRYLMAGMTLEIGQLEKSPEGKRARSSRERRAMIEQLIKQSLTNAKSDCSARTELFRLTGTYRWIIGDQRRALVWWGRSMKEGERLGANPELSRTYDEVGRRLSEPGSRYKQLFGIGPDAYHERARNLTKIMSSD